VGRNYHDSTLRAVGGYDASHHAHEESQPLDTRRLSVPGTDEGICAALDALSALWADHGLSRAVTWPLDVSLDEVLANLVHHALAGRSDSRIEIGIQLDAAARPPVCELVVSDDGPAFDPLTAAEPDTTLPLEERPAGGLGIALVRRLVDELAYERRGGRNHLRLRRRLVAMEA
jgi:serine/threonine-protein kinase RsbW